MNKLWPVGIYIYVCRWCWCPARGLWGYILYKYLWPLRNGSFIVTSTWLHIYILQFH